MNSILYIVNPVSGKKTRKAGIIDYLRSRGAEIIFTEYAGHAEKIARECEHQTVVAVGGDGTVNEVARGLYGTGKTMGIIPCGSGDGLALCLGLSHDVRKAMEVVEKGKTAMLDCAQVDGRPFFSVCGVGFDAEISRRFASSTTRGLGTYIAECVKLWFSYKPEKYRVLIDGTVIETSPMLITVGNSNQWGNGARVTPAADPCDGLLDVAVVDPFHIWEVPYMAWQLLLGDLSRSRHLHYYRGKNIVVERSGAGAAHFDGDYFEGSRRVEVGLMGEKLKVIVP